MMAGVSCGRLRWDSFRVLGASLCPMLLAIGAMELPKASLWPEEIINSTFFVAGDNNTIEMNCLRDHSSEYAHSVFYRLPNRYIIFIFHNEAPFFYTFTHADGYSRHVKFAHQFFISYWKELSNIYGRVYTFKKNILAL